VCVASDNRHIMAMWPVRLVLYFSTLFYGRKYFRKNVVEHKIHVSIFSSNFFFGNLSHSKKNSERYDKKKYIGLYVIYLLFLSDFNEI